MILRWIDECYQHLVFVRIHRLPLPSGHYRGGRIRRRHRNGSTGYRGGLSEGCSSHAVEMAMYSFFNRLGISVPESAVASYGS